MLYQDKAFEINRKAEYLAEMIELGLDLLHDCAMENPECSRSVEASLRMLRRHVESHLGERDDCGELLPETVHKAPAFCRRECAGQGPNCGGCDHGGYGPEYSKIYAWLDDAVDSQVKTVEHNLNTLVHVAPSCLSMPGLVHIKDIVEKLIERETPR